ncbi:MAG: MarR family winged helix-turn-helix transcriptional regulator [Pseudomonadota bacterium]|nr:MarR family winged helix-turn-helix transcriptional regulator [Pseudomonadota bacterium]
MDSSISYLSPAHSLDSRPPVLVAASSAQGRDNAARLIEQSGWRAVSFPIDGAIARLALQASASGLWIELSAEDDGTAVERLLSHANHEAAAGRLSTIIAAPAALIDLVSARIDAEGTQLLVEPDPFERAAALALSLAAAHGPPTLHDVAREPASRRLKELSDEVGRIAATLARLSSGPEATARSADAPAPAKSVERLGDKLDIPPVSGEAVRNVIRARRLRARYFDELLFADPAWDMLLDLLQAEIAQHRVPVSSLCIAAAVPATTALRWIKTMTDNGLFVRRADPHDGRRVFIELAPDTSAGMRRYFAEVGAIAGS